MLCKFHEVFLVSAVIAMIDKTFFKHPQLTEKAPLKIFLRRLAMYIGY